MISRLCEEFPAYGPEEAAAAWENNPRLLHRILTLRAFARADAYRRQMEQTDPSKMEITKNVQRVMEIEAIAVAEVMHGSESR